MNSTRSLLTAKRYEQINRQVVEKIDTLIVLTDSAFRGMKTISHIKEMRDEGLLPFCKKIGVVFNRTRNDVSKLEAFAKELGLEILGRFRWTKKWRLTIAKANRS